MKKVAIITDSTGGVRQQDLAEFNVSINHLVIIFKEKVYQEFKDINPEKFVQLSHEHDELPTTSQAAPGQTIELYEQVLANGYDEIIHITVASKLSGSYQSALSCATMVDEQRIHIFDSKTIAYPQGAMAVAAAKKAHQGASIAEIIKDLEAMRDASHLSAAIYHLTNLRKGGRLSNVEASLGSLLQIKPIVQIQPDGTLEAVVKVRTFKKAIASLLERAKAANLTEAYEIGILHMENKEGAELIYNEIKKIYPNLNIQLLPLSLVVAVHAGQGAVGIGWVKTKNLY